MPVRITNSVQRTILQQQLAKKHTAMLSSSHRFILHAQNTLGHVKQSLFRYLSPQYADTFVHRGEILFRALSFYRDYEDDDIRSDEFEGTRLHLPEGGLKVKKVAKGEIVPLPYSFESTAQENDIFVYCLSTVRSEILADKFKTRTCVEIHNPAMLIARIRQALMLRPSIKNKHLEFGPVKYYAPHEPPIVDWALPERIALSKPATFAWQDEYRIAFGINGAFDVGNVQVRLVAPGDRGKKPVTNHPERLFKLGSMTKLCTIHHL